MKHKTLYVSDLDGTLLRSDRKTSDYTNSVINSLAERGFCFSYATARSLSTARKVTVGMNAHFPLIVYNGAMIVDNAGGEMLLKNVFGYAEASGFLSEILEKGFSPMVYALINGEEKFSYIMDEINRPTKDFVISRKGDRRDRPVKTREELFGGDMFYFNIIDEAARLVPLYEKYREVFHCVYSQDIYTGEQWLEVMPKNASKANAARQLADMLGCGRIVAFGDGMNDVDLFAEADECYAVANAEEELKKHATAVIGSNDEDAVAHWLEEHCKGEI